MKRPAAVVLAAAALLALAGCSRELVVLLPDDAGHVGSLRIVSEDSEVTLDRAYAAVEPGDAEAADIEEAEVQRRFGAALAATPEAAANFTIYFQEGSTEPSRASSAEFERMLAEAARRPAPDVQVTGHTDRLGSVADNDRLSALRAAVIRSALLARGVTAGRVLAVGRGEREPLIATADGVSEPRNRRVEITVR